MKTGYYETKWKTMYGTIKIKAKKKKDKRKVAVVKALINFQIKQMHKCFGHEMNYAFNKHFYRRYRKGKNRCEFCGLKLGGENEIQIYS